MTATEKAEAARLFDRLLDDDPRREIGEEDWNRLKKILATFLSYAARFYYSHDCRDYEFALGIAWHVLKGSSPENVIHCIGGLAHFMLETDDELVAVTRDLTDDTRTSLVGIRGLSDY